MKKLFALAAVLLLMGTSAALADNFRHPAPEIEKITMASPLPTAYFSNDDAMAVLAYRKCRSVPIAELAESEARIGGVHPGAGIVHMA